MTDELAHLGVGELRRRLDTDDVSPVEVVEALLGRIDRLDGSVRSVVEINDQAIDDARRAAGRRGGLAGIPVLLKDNIDTAAPLHTTAGSLALANDHAAEDAPLVTSLKTAGAIVLGKLNLTEWANYRSAHMASGWSAVGGLTVNPHDPLRSPGGSSAGSGAALAARFAPLTVGTETDGSISCPASLNGVVGIKPTVGLIPRTGIVPISHTQDTPGPMARSVRDAAAMLTVLAGSDARDDATAREGRPEPLDYESFCRAGRLDGVRIGVPTGTSLFGYHRDLDASVRQALDVLADLGAQLVEGVALPGLDNGGVELTVLDHEIRHDLAQYLQTRPGSGLRTLADVIRFNATDDEELRWFGQDTFERAERTTGLDAAVYLEARTHARRAAGHDGITGALRTHDVHALAMPCYAPAWSNDMVHGDPSAGGCSTLPAMGGFPLLSVPCGTVPGPNGALPVALGLTAGPWSEPVLLRIASAYEAAVTRREDSDGSISPQPRLT